MGVGTGLYMYDAVVKKFTFTISPTSWWVLVSCGLCECVYCG